MDRAAWYSKREREKNTNIWVGNFADGETSAHEHGKGRLEHADAHIRRGPCQDASDLHEFRRYRVDQCTCFFCLTLIFFALYHLTPSGNDQDENPLERASWIAKKHAFQTPLDEIDAAARILDPVFSGVKEGTRLYGKF